MSEKRFKKGDWTNCRYDICEIVTDDDEIICVVALNDADKIIGLLEENEQLKERLYDFEKRKIIEESLIDEDVTPKIKLLRSELFGEKYE